MDTSRNQICYGNIVLTAVPRDGAPSLKFEKTGDRASVTDIESLRLSSMSLADDSWGVALMKVQANLPDTLPGQNVTFLLFGDVEIDNSALDAPEVKLTTTHDVNVRARPSSSANNILTSIKSGTIVAANGRLAGNSWVRIKLDGDKHGGWVSADYLKGDLNALAVVKPTDTTWGPMQSFYFKTGKADRPCAEAPDSGILIQTPKGSGQIILNANDVEIRLGSTVYLQAQPGNVMTVSVVEGHATLTADGQTQLVPAGTQSTVHLDAAGKADGKPSVPKPYDAAALQTLPLNVSVLNRVQIAKALTPAEIKTALSPGDTATNGSDSAQNNGLPPSGAWSQVNTLTVKVCPNTTNLTDGTSQQEWRSTIVFSPNRDTLTIVGGWEVETRTLSRVSDNVYKAQFSNEYGDPHSIALTFTSATTYHISAHATFYAGTCGFDYDGTGTFKG